MNTSLLFLSPPPPNLPRNLSSFPSLTFASLISNPKPKLKLKLKPKLNSTSNRLDFRVWAGDGDGGGDDYDMDEDEAEGLDNKKDYDVEYDPLAIMAASEELECDFFIRKPPDPRLAIIGHKFGDQICT